MCEFFDTSTPGTRTPRLTLDIRQAKDDQGHRVQLCRRYVRRRPTPERNGFAHSLQTLYLSSLVAEKKAQEAKEGKDAKNKGGPVGITSLKPKEASDRISRMKAKNMSPGDAMVEAKAKKIKNGFDEILARIYRCARLFG